MSTEVVEVEQLFNYFGKKMTREECLAALGVKDADPEHQERIFQKFLKKGNIKPIGNKTKQQEALEQVQAEIITETVIDVLTEEDQVYATHKRKKHIENKGLLVEEEVKFTVASRMQMEKVRGYLTAKAIKYAVMQDVDSGEYVFSLFNVTVPELNALDRYMKGQEIAIAVKSMGGKATNGTSAVLQGAVAASSAVVGAASNIAIKTSGQIASSAMQIGAEAIVAGRDVFREKSHELANDKRIHEAKLVMNGWMDAAKRKLGGSGKGSRFF